MKTLKDIEYEELEGETYRHGIKIVGSGILRDVAREWIKKHESSMKYIERDLSRKFSTISPNSSPDYGLWMYHKGIVESFKGFFNLEDRKEPERISYKLPNSLLRCFMQGPGTGVTVKTDDGRILELDLISVKEECKLIHEKDVELPPNPLSIKRYGRRFNTREEAINALDVLTRAKKIWSIDFGFRDGYWEACWKVIE